MAVVDAVVADVERGKDDDAVAVDLLLELTRGGKDRLGRFLRIGGYEVGDLLHRERNLLHAFGDDVTHAQGVLAAIGDQGGQGGIIDEIDGAFR